jgi:hypothetical protein
MIESDRRVLTGDVVIRPQSELVLALPAPVRVRYRQLLPLVYFYGTRLIFMLT